MKEVLQTTGSRCVESSAGWKVDILSSDALVYAEEGKSIRLELEDRPDAQDELEWILYTPERWSWREEDEPLTQEKISDILNRIELAFWKLDLKMKEIV
ncbi:MAG: hypothetical protein GXY72_09100 [Deltaproteobacteria bacterium]|nr:hypothetical protein [Syntrophaceae bacterium]NLX52240.1 hypothetical protein [Deltaproteobacteria bacterium]